MGGLRKCRSAGWGPAPAALAAAASLPPLPAGRQRQLAALLEGCSFTP